MLLNVLDVVKKAYVEEKQVRRADESSTLFLDCLECGYKWRIG